MRCLFFYFRIWTSIIKFESTYCDKSSNLQNMQNNNLPKQALLVFSGSLKTVRSRKTVICFAIMGFFILYLVSAYLLPAHRHFHKNQIQNIKPVETSCLDKYLQLKWNKLMEVNDAVVKKIPASPTGNRFFPFTGILCVSSNSCLIL